MFQNKRKKDEFEILDTGVNNYPNLGSKDTVKKLAEDYVNYNYDTFTEGDSYKSLEKRYQTGGQKAMQDTVGQVSARTGGLASSYATVAGQQTYNDWMGNLESAARALYDSERQEMGDRYALANSMYLQERDEQRYDEELAYDRQWNEDEREYNRSESSRLEGEGKAYDTVVALINAGTPIDKIDPALIAKTGYYPSHFKAMAKSYTDDRTKDSLQDLMDIMDRGGTVTLQQWKDAGGLKDDYDMYASIGANADAEEASAKAAEDANEAILFAFKNGKSLDEIDSELITASGMSKALLTAMDEYYANERQNAADEKAADEIATAQANAANDVIMYLGGGTKTLDELEAEGLLASTGRGRDWWEGNIAYQNKINPQEVEEVAEFYKVDYEDAANWMAEMEKATKYEEAMDIAALVARSSGNWDFADELLTSWMNKYKNTPAG